jgi:hypothetical protein
MKRMENTKTKLRVANTCNPGSLGVCNLSPRQKFEILSKIKKRTRSMAEFKPQYCQKEKRMKCKTFLKVCVGGSLQIFGVWCL